MMCVEVTFKDSGHSYVFNCFGFKVVCDHPILVLLDKDGNPVFACSLSAIEFSVMK